jgi:hypothetical protein
VDAAAPMRGRALLTHGEVIAALVANRLSAPSPLYDIAGWASSAAMAELFDTPAGLLNDDRLGRALEALAPIAEDVRGQLLLTTIDRFDVADATRLHLDLTTIRFAGAYEGSTLVAKGWGADRTVARQVRTLQASTPGGVALYLRPHKDPHKGSAAELSCLGEALERLCALLPTAPVIVADSALGHLGNLCALHRASVKFVVPLRADTGWAAQFDRDVGALDRLAIWTTQPNANNTCRPSSGLGGVGCWPTGRSPTRPPTLPVICASPTSGHPKKPDPSPTLDNARWPKPKRR